MNTDGKEANSFDEYNHLGNTFYASGDFDSAIAAFNRCAQIAPEHPQIQNNLGQILYQKRDLVAAAGHFRRAIQIKPDYAIAHWNLANALLAVGNFEQGLEEFEWRLSIPALQLDRGFSQPRWDGSDANGKSILLHCEGGHGDAMQFVRFIPLISSLGGKQKLILECQPALLALFLESIHGVQIIGRGQSLPAFDFQIPLLSLPRIFRTNLQTIPHSIPYLKTPAAVNELWKSRLSLDHKIKNVGLVWAGSPTKLRTDSIDIYGPLSGVPNARFYSLQVGPKARQAPPPGLDLVDLTQHIGDFADAAAFIQQLDLVITIDTSIAHLAGALAKPVWVAIPYCSDFRWLMDRSDSPWYPTMRLFRQPKAGDWQTPVSNMAHALALWSRG